MLLEVKKTAGNLLRWVKLVHGCFTFKWFYKPEGQILQKELFPDSWHGRPVCFCHPCWLITPGTLFLVWGWHAPSSEGADPSTSSWTGLCRLLGYTEKTPKALEAVRVCDSKSQVEVDKTLGESEFQIPILLTTDPGGPRPSLVHGTLCTHLLLHFPLTHSQAPRVAQEEDSGVQSLTVTTWADVQEFSGGARSCVVQGKRYIEILSQALRPRHFSTHKGHGKEISSSTCFFFFTVNYLVHRNSALFFLVK